MTKLLSAALAATLCSPLLAEELRLAAGPAAAPCSSFFAEERAPSFSFEESDLGFSPEGARTHGPQPRRFALCPDAAETPPSSRAGFSLAPPLFTFEEIRNPRDPLGGVRNADATAGKRFWRGMVIITGTEIASGVVLALLPKTNTNWDEDAFSRASENFRRAWTTPPVWDSDGAFHDWFGHPYAGAFYYNMIRSQGGTIGQSFGFTVLQSLLWEYVLEAWAEQPSIQDIVSTTLLGAAVGELFHRWSTTILSKGRLNLGQKVLVFFLNPSYVINNGYRPPG